MNHVSIPKDPDSSVQLRPLVDFRDPNKMVIPEWTQAFIKTYWKAVNRGEPDER